MRYELTDLGREHGYPPMMPHDGKYADEFVHRGLYSITYPEADPIFDDYGNLIGLVLDTAKINHPERT